MNAGTVEFLVADGRYWFSELNARLQVEHPVTELVTGLDLVEWQLRLAAGEPLEPLPEPVGHAVEVRLYAEHPLTFLPQAGTVSCLELPERIRIDAGVEAGDAVPLSYDPLIAKLAARGETRDEALDRISDALRETRIRGVATNRPFLQWLVDHPGVREGSATTAFLDLAPAARKPQTRGSPVVELLASQPPSLGADAPTLAAAGAGTGRRGGLGSRRRRQPAGARPRHGAAPARRRG